MYPARPMAKHTGARDAKPVTSADGGGADRRAARSRDHTTASEALPSAVERVLRDHADAWAQWQKLAASHRKEYVTWITSAKRRDTAERRLALAVEKLRAGTKTPMRANGAPPVSDAPLEKKLGIKPGMGVVVIAAPGTERPIVPGATSNGSGDLVVAFARDIEDLGQVAPRALAALAPGGALWIAYRKKGAAKSDLSRDRGWEVVTRAGWRPVSLVAVDATWSALRFKTTGR